MTTTLADGHVTVPSSTWKVALVLPKDAGDDLSRVGCSTRTIAVIMPNQDGIRNELGELLDDRRCRGDPDGVQLLLDLPEPYQQCIKAGTNGNNPPLVKGNQTITFAAPADRIYGDPPFTVVATGGASGNPVTFAASGACTSGGLNGATITLLAPGSCSVTASQAGSDIYNAAADVVRTFTVLPWTLSGFYQPVDMGGIWNTVKNGSTVPLKFAVFAGSTELTNTSVIVQPLTATQSPCSGGPTDDIEILATGGTALRYDTARAVHL